MSGIVGIAQPDQQAQVKRMLDKIAHRGPSGQVTLEINGHTLGLAWPSAQANAVDMLKQAFLAQDEMGAGRLAQAQAAPSGFLLKRDRLGVAPLYYGRNATGALCFASEIKALLEVTRDVYELLPGHLYNGEIMRCYFYLENQPLLEESPLNMALELHRRLTSAVKAGLSNGEAGAWLSGGLDSSTMAALARPYVNRLHTFAVGFPGAPDLDYARLVAAFIQSEHHEIVVSFEEMLVVLPEVIYHLESFDALLVRSSITNYLVAKATADYVPLVLSGEGGDELFAGYSYLKSFDQVKLANELLDITGQLHNTALQRVDRCAAAHGIVAHVGFLEPLVVDYALRIPVMFKLYDGIEKIILRQAMKGALPDEVLNRTKSKFWEGAGVGTRLAAYANERIRDEEFSRERTLLNGWVLNTKEELMYYRLFREHFGDFNDLSWMGRTKGAPMQ